MERSVTVGDRDLPIARFRGLKAVLAGALVSKVMRELPEVQKQINKFVQDYREENKVRITPAMAKLPRFSVLGLTSEDFKATENGIIELPDEPTVQQVWINMTPLLFEMARQELMRFLALIAIPNAELERADDADDVEGALLIYGRQLFREGDIDQLLELLAVGWEVMEDQILSKKDKLGKLQRLPFVQMLLSTQESSTSETESELEEMEPEEESPTLKTSPDELPNSSTDSADSTDGIDEQPSMEPLGTSS